MIPKLLFTAATVAVAASIVTAAERARVEIAISETGEVSIAGQRLTRDELSARLAAAAGQKEKPEVLILASEHAPLDAVAAVMNECRKCGLSKFSLRTR